MILLHQALSGEEASSAGLVSKLVAKGQALSAALEIAEKLASQSLPTVVLAKEAICRGQSAEFLLLCLELLTCFKRIIGDMTMLMSGRCTILRSGPEIWSRA